MALRNYMEDVVIDVLNILLKDRSNVCKSKQCKLDIIAFALNRLPPKYIVSERGFTHAYIEEINNVGLRGDVISVVNLGIDIISKRKRRNYNHQNLNEDYNIIREVENLFTKEKNVYYYNFPHLVGQVFDKDTYEFLADVKVTLYLDDKIVESQDISWINPYITNTATQGFYSFWTKSIRIETKDPKPQKFTFKLLFTKKNYYSRTSEFYVVIEPEEVLYRFIRRNFTEKIDVTILEKRKR